MLSLNMSLVYNIINLIILYLLLKKFLFRPVTAIMEKRRKMIEDGLANAQHTQQEAAALKEQYEEALRGAKAQSNQIIQTAQADAKKEYDRILEEADSQAGKLLKDAREAISQEREKTLQDMKSQIAGLAVTAAAKIVGEQKGRDEEALYDQFLRETGEANEDRDHQ